MAAIDDAQLIIRKQLVASGPDAIANEFRGTGTGGAARGTESWLFNAAGEVREHHLVAWFNVDGDR
jgi:hypothetical protein